MSPGNADFDTDTASMILTYLDAGAPVVTLAGAHPGCYALFAAERVRSIHAAEAHLEGPDWQFLNELKKELKT